MGLSGRRLTLVLSTLLGVIVVAGAAAAFAVGRAQRLAGHPGGMTSSQVAPDSAPGSPPSAGAASGSRTSSPPDQRPAATPAGTTTPPVAPSPSPVAGPSPSARPQTPGSGTAEAPMVSVELSPRAAAAPQAQEVSDLLTRYFTAINRHDYDAWLTTVSTSQATRTRDNWVNGYGTTRDSNVYVSDLYNKGTHLLVRIQFMSHQAVTQAPSALPLPCVRWDVTYEIVDEGPGLRVGNSVTPPSLARCP